MHNLFVLAFLGTTAVTTSAEEDISSSDVQARLKGDYRINGTGLSRMRVDADGRRYDQSYLFEQRLRFSPELSFYDNASIRSEFQLLGGLVTADQPNARFEDYGFPRGDNGSSFGDDALEQLKVRKLYLNARTPIGLLRFGRTESQWGLGILANSGDDEQQDWGSPNIGTDFNYGDVVNRVLFATAPLAKVSDSTWAQNTFLAVGGDIIERDENFSRAQGDQGRQGVAALRYAHEGNELGMYVAYRDVDDRNNDTLNVTAYDIFGKGKWDIGRGEVFAQGELVFANGNTTLAKNNAFPEEIRVQQLGYVVRAGGGMPGWGMFGDLEVGYASGDSNPNDRFLRNFTFDPNYNPSLILFDQLMAAQTVAATAQGSDPSKVGVPQDALRFLPTNGGVTNAMYVRPTFRYHVEEQLKARLAVMYARAEEDVVDPYNSTVAGGTAVNFLGGDGGARDLGLEVNVGVDYEHDLRDDLKLALSLQGGRLWPGKAFDNALGRAHPAVNLVFARVGLFFHDDAPNAP